MRVVVRAGLAAHRFAARAYPAEFRRQFGPEIERVVELRVTRARDPLAASALAAYFTLDALASGLVERAHRASLRRRWPRQAAPAPQQTPLMTLDSIGRDLRLALRQFRRSPIFALLTVGSLGLGIGANTAIFSVVQALLLRPLPYANPDELVMIWSDNARQGEPNNPVSPADAEAFRRAPSLSAAETMYSFLVQQQVRFDGDPDLLQVSAVTPGMFALLGRRALVGRTFDAHTTGVVLSHQFWQRRFAGDPGVIGRTGSAIGGGPPLTILGVMPADFVFPYRSMLGPTGFTRAIQPDVWIPLTPASDSRLVDATGQPNRTIHYLGVVGRRAQGASLDAVARDLQSIAKERAARFPDTNVGWNATVRSLHEQAVGNVRPAVLILLGGVGVVLFITCINVANVLLARVTGRQHDLSIRSALGASRSRLLQQTLVESLTLSGAGGALGLAAALLGIKVLVGIAPPNLPRLSEVGLDAVVLAFTIIASMATGLAVGLIPALSASRSHAQDVLRETRRTTASRGRQRLRAALIVTEVALAMILAVGAGLLLRSFVAVLAVNPGFESNRLLTLQMNVPPRIVDRSARLEFYDALEARLLALPGVTHVGGTTRLPLGSTNVTTLIDIEGRGLTPASFPEVEFRRAVFDYFATMGIPIVRGRTFTQEDTLGSPTVVVINTVLADRVFPGEDPVGRRVRLGGDPSSPWIPIVGVIGSVRHGSLEETPRPELYVTYRQNPPVAPYLAIRASGDAASLAPAVRRAIRDLGADSPFDVRTMEQIRSASVAERRFVLLLVSVFGGLALALAAIGVYGIITLVAEERVTEVGIRLALGSSPSQVLSLVLGHAVRLTLAGILLGAAVALAGAPALRSQLFGVGGHDPATFAGVALTLLAVATLAAYVPARRAMRVDPARTLRG